MNKCLVTKLNATVDNDSLLHMGELRIPVEKLTSATSTTQKLIITFNEDTYIEIIGDGYFTDENLTANLGKKKQIPANVETTTYFSNGDFSISIKNKYALKGINMKNALVDIGEFKYSNSLTKLQFQNCTKVTGDLDALKNLTAINLLYLSSTKVTGDIAALKNMTALVDLYLSNTKVTGDLDALKNCVSLLNLGMRGSNTKGDIAVLKNLTSLLTCSLNSVLGDITALNSTKLTDIIISNSGGLTGDIAKLKSGFKYLGLDGDSTSTFTWSSRDTNSITFGNGGSPILSTSLDDMLINMAQCRNGLTSSSSSWEKNISYQGNRTSASDAAVEKLQSYGYTVSITKA